MTIHRRIRSNVCYNFCKGISYFYVSRCVPSLHRIQYGTYTRATLPWMCAIKRRLPSHPRLMVILLGEIEGFSFPAKKSVDGLPLPPSLTLGLECAILPGSFSDPPTSRKRRRRPRELSVSPTDFSIKLRKRPARARWDPPPSPSTDAPSPLSRTYSEKERVATPARENSIPRIIQTCRWKDGVRGEKHFNGDYSSQGYSCGASDTGGREGLEKRKDERSLRGETGRECKKPGKPKRAALAR